MGGNRRRLQGGELEGEEGRVTELGCKINKFIFLKKSLLQYEL